MSYIFLNSNLYYAVLVEITSIFPVCFEGFNLNLRKEKVANVIWRSDCLEMCLSPKTNIEEEER